MHIPKRARAELQYATFFFACARFHPLFESFERRRRRRSPNRPFVARFLHLFLCVDSFISRTPQNLSPCVEKSKSWSATLLHFQVKGQTAKFRIEMLRLELHLGSESTNNNNWNSFGVEFILDKDRPLGSRLAALS